MGLATIDPHSQKEHTEIHKIPMFGVNQARFDSNTAIEKRYNQPAKNVWPSGHCRVGQRPDMHGHTFFVNFDIFKWLYLAYYWVYLHQTWGFCKAWYALYDYVDQLLLTL